MIPTPESVPLDVIDQYANTICPTCLGDGSLEVQAATPPDAIEPRHEWVPCPDCRATGWTGVPYRPECHDPFRWGTTDRFIEADDIEADDEDEVAA